MLTLDSVFDRLLFADEIETPYPDDAPLISTARIERELDRIETPLADAQLAILEQQTEVLLEAAIPLIDAQDITGLAQLTWTANIALQVPIYEVWQQGYRLGAEHLKAEVRAAIPARDRAQFAIDPGTAGLLNQFLNQEPLELRASAVETAVQQRAVYLAGNFSASQISTLRQDLIAAVIPQADTGNPISRRELLGRIEKNLNVGRVRANAIARTELTDAYNIGRDEMGMTSVLVEAYRFLSIDDFRRTDICRSRHGMIIPKNDREAVAANRPSLHISCRSNLSPVLPRVNSKHREWISDPGRRAINRTLVSLPDGWNQPVTEPDYVRYINRGRRFAQEAGIPESLPTAPGIREAVSFIDNTPEGQALLEQMPELFSRLTSGYNANDAKLVKISKAALATAPEENLRDAINSFSRLTKGRGLPNRLVFTDERASSFPDAGLINVGLNDTLAMGRRTLFHEMGHLLESELGIQATAQAWVRSKATGPETSLALLTGFAEYGDETAFPDAFSDPYVGKIYGDGYTEVISVGMEHFVSPFAAAILQVVDPGHFYFMLGVLADA